MEQLTTRLLQFEGYAEDTGPKFSFACPVCLQVIEVSHRKQSGDLCGCGHTWRLEIKAVANPSYFYRLGPTEIK